MTSDVNGTTIDIDDNNSEVQTDKNYYYVDIFAFGLENAAYSSSTDEWEEFVGELEFDEITASASHAKRWKLISTEHLSKVWHIDTESAQQKINVTTQRGVGTGDPKTTR